MTHDELVDIAIVKDLNKLILKQMKAIDAVFELHTGFSTGECTDPECCSSGPDYLCSACQEDYPCPTIQAIEKELS